LFAQIVFGTDAGTIWVLDTTYNVAPDSDCSGVLVDSTPVWAWVIICISCFFGGVVLSAMAVWISRRLAKASADTMKKPLLSHHDAL
jgi:hypothetical protein